MTAAQTVVIFCVAPLGAVAMVLICSNFGKFSNFKTYKKIYQSLCRGAYTFDGNLGGFIYFRKTDEPDINQIIFFPDGDIKLQENLYIHKNLHRIYLADLYYYKKFHRVKNYLIHRHIMNESFRNLNGIFVKKNKEPFKFLS